MEQQPGMNALSLLPSSRPRGKEGSFSFQKKSR